jgi:hypothetical protein
MPKVEREQSAEGARRLGVGAAAQADDAVAFERDTRLAAVAEGGLTLGAFDAFHHPHHDTIRYVSL